MHAPFACVCGADNCQKHIRGAAFLPTSVLLNYRLSPVITQLLASRAYESARNASLATAKGMREPRGHRWSR
jgi:hypothetical protein